MIQVRRLELLVWGFLFGITHVSYILIFHINTARYGISSSDKIGASLSAFKATVFVFGVGDDRTIRHDVCSTHQGTIEFEAIGRAIPSTLVIDNMCKSISAIVSITWMVIVCAWLTKSVLKNLWCYVTFVGLHLFSRVMNLQATHIRYVLWALDIVVSLILSLHFLVIHGSYGKPLVLMVVTI